MNAPVESSTKDDHVVGHGATTRSSRSHAAPAAGTGPSASSSTLFPVGPAGKRELRRALLRSTDPVHTIETFQRTHSLHSMLAVAFGTSPRHSEKESAAATATTPTNGHRGSQMTEPLDTDPVMRLLNHLGVSHYEIHKRISDTLLKELETIIRQTTATEPLLQLLQASWVYATTIPEVRPIVWAVLKQLGDRTPTAVLQALAERDSKALTPANTLKHYDLFHALPSSLKRLVWEQDFTEHIPAAMEYDNSVDLNSFRLALKNTLLFDALHPYVDQYCQSRILMQHANRPFVATAHERRMLTTQRRALMTPTTNTASKATITTSSNASSTVPAGSAGLLRTAMPGTGLAGTGTGASSGNHFLGAGKAIAQLRTLLCDRIGTATSFRPKLLYGLLSMLMVRHGERRTHGRILGADGLCCTCLADILLAAGGPLPKSYNDVLKLARLLDESVQEGNLTDAAIVNLQLLLRRIFQTEGADIGPGSAGIQTLDKKLTGQTNALLAGKITKESLEIMPTTGMQRQLNRIITNGLGSMKENDTQHLFLNPVTDKIAPGYSDVIKQPMCMILMQAKVEKNDYRTITDWESDVKLMYKNCIDYNRGAAGQWFRGEAMRQSKAFREEIFPVARREYQNELAKRTVMPEEIEARKRQVEERSESAIQPLPPTNKKRKKEVTIEYQLSMPAVASMLLADPFVTRLILARILREIRTGVLGCAALPISHAILPSLVQMMHIVMWSSQICASRGRKYFVPDVGCASETAATEEMSSDDPISSIPYVTLRRSLPLLIRLLLEADFDRRVAVGGDLYSAGQISPIISHTLSMDLWTRDAKSHPEVDFSLLAGSLVHLCQPGMKNETSLSVTFPKFAEALRSLFPNLIHDRPFFLSLIFALLKHKSKLQHSTRDAVLESWLGWLRRPRSPTPVAHDKIQNGESVIEEGSMTSSAHECFILLLNEWSSLGNQVLPRDLMIRFSIDAVHSTNDSESNPTRKFIAVFSVPDDSMSASVPSMEKISENIGDSFALVRKQYERMLKHLPANSAEQWKKDTGLIVGYKSDVNMGEDREGN